MQMNKQNWLAGLGIIAVCALGVAGGYVAYQTQTPTTTEDGNTTENTTPTTTVNQQTASKLCGDGVCDAIESARGICPKDCATQDAASGFTKGTEANTYYVVNPTSGDKLYTWVIYPSGKDGDASLPPIVLIPGSTETSDGFTAGERKDAQPIADAGFAVYAFDPEGRGKSEGEEDNNGSIGQDGLAEIINFASAQQSQQAVGVISFSYGVTMATGALARHQDLPVAFLIDWEGPADRNDTGGCDADDTGHMKDVGCTNEAFWKEREAINFVDQLTVPYLRIQSQKDHSQPDTLSAVRMVNAAVAGTSPWVRLNDGKADATYSESTPPTMLPETFDRVVMKRLGVYAQEMFAL